MSLEEPPCRTDPYYQWAEATHFAGLGLAANQTIPVLVECKDVDSAAALAKQLREETKAYVPLVEKSKYLTAYIPYEQRHCALELICKTKAPWEVGLPFCSPDAVEIRQHPELLSQQESMGSPKSEKNIIGFIDYGCAFAHQNFRQWVDGKMTNGTRVFALWDQGRELTDKPSGRLPANIRPLNWNMPLGFLYGAEILRDKPKGKFSHLEGLLDNLTLANLNLKIAGAPHATSEHVKKFFLNEYIKQFASTSGQPLDEEKCYSFSEYKAIQTPMTHGTHVMDVAAGYPDPALAPGATPGEVPDSDLIFVQLPRFFSASTSGDKVQVSGLLRTYVLDAVRYIFSHAKVGSSVTINLSYGANTGPHNGDSILEHALDEAIELIRKDSNANIVIAAGNSYSENLHACASAEKIMSEPLALSNVPDNPTDQFVEVWLDGESSALCDIRLSPPGYQPTDSDWVKHGDTKEIRTDEALIAMVVRPLYPCQSDRGCMVLICIAPTVSIALRKAAPYGNWKLEVRSTKTPSQTMVNAWCERDEPVFGSGSGPRQIQFRNHIVKSNSLNSIAHGRNTIVVGGYVENRYPSSDGKEIANGRIADYSSEGPGRGVGDGNLSRYPPVSKDDVGKPGPEIVAVADESDALPGLAAAAVHANDKARLAGTSIAAAVVTRFMAAQVATSQPGLNARNATASNSATALRQIVRDGKGGLASEDSRIKRGEQLVTGEN